MRLRTATTGATAARNQRRPTAAILPRETPFSHGDPHLARREGSGAGGRDAGRDATRRTRSALLGGHVTRVS